MIPLLLALAACVDGPGRGFSRVDDARLDAHVRPHDDVRLDAATLRLGDVRFEGVAGLPEPEAGHAHRGDPDHEGEHEHDEGALFLLTADGPLDLLGGSVALGPAPLELPAGRVERVVVEVQGGEVTGTLGVAPFSATVGVPFEIASEAELVVGPDQAPALALELEFGVDAAALLAVEGADGADALIEALRASELHLHVEAIE